MRSNLSLFLSVLALLTFANAGPSFRLLQSNVTVVTNSTNTSVVTNSSTANLHPGYAPLTLDFVQNDLNATLAYQHAMHALIQTGIAQGKLPISVYTVSNFYGAWWRTVRRGANYIFWVDLIGDNGVKIHANVTNFRNYTDGLNTMVAYHYTASNINRNMFPGDGYRFLTPGQMHNNTIDQGALIYGAETMIEWLISQYKIPTTSLNYTIYDLYLAAYKRFRTGTSFKFQIFGINEVGLNIKTNFTVFYRNSDKSYHQTAYWYRVWNYSRSDINFPSNNTNTTNSGTNVTVSTINTSTTTTVTSNSTDNTTAVVTATNATSGSNSTSEIMPINSTSNSTGFPPQVNVNITLVTMDNSTATTTSLINLNYTFPANQTGTANSTSTTNETLPTSNVTVIDTTTPPVS